MENVQLTQEYLDKYYFEMFSKAGENACRSIVSAAWKKLAGSKRVTGQEMYDYLKARMDVVSAKHGEVWDTEPREKIYWLVAKKAKEYDYDFTEYFGTGF
jgi:hypothetical protein